MSQSNILSMTEAVPKNGGALARSDESRKIAEIKAALTIAKSSPRNFILSEQTILENCKRKSFAEVAAYQFPRGGQTVRGPSIRMAEMLAQNWGNMEFGWREVERQDGESTVESFAWDLQTNVKKTVQFQVRHIRDTRQGPKKLTDERDIYEMCANQASRRLRSCILNVIPGDVIETAMNQCQKTLEGGNNEPLKDRISRMVQKFSKFGVTLNMITDRIGHDTDAMTEPQLQELFGIFTSIKDGESKREDWFEVKGKSPKQQEPEDGDDTDLAPSKPKLSKTKQQSKPKHDSSLLEEEEQPNQIDPLISQVFDVLGDHMEEATKYAIDQEWITKSQSLEDLRKPHAKAILSNPKAFIQTISKA